MKESKRLFFLKAAQHYATKSPGMSRILMFHLQQDVEQDVMVDFQASSDHVCVYCSTLFIPMVNCDVQYFRRKGFVVGADFRKLAPAGRGMMIYKCRTCRSSSCFPVPRFGISKKRKEKDSGQDQQTTTSAPAIPLSNKKQRQEERYLKRQRRETQRQNSLAVQQASQQSTMRRLGLEPSRNLITPLQKVAGGRTQTQPKAPATIHAPTQATGSFTSFLASLGL
eukprot:GGOE01018409.1.p1 GENE.GGOE01018409.1~~GGOE01018409.1.p1  ORF type:complete len:235 (+),score=25.54 GGOE01018409.1:35-706(+)